VTEGEAMKMPRLSRRGREALLVGLSAVTLLALAVPAAAGAAVKHARGGEVALRLADHFRSRPYAPSGARLPFAGPQQAVCGRPAPGEGECLIHVLAPSERAPGASSATTTIANPTGLSPAAIKAVYGYTTAASAGAGETIALVDAYNDVDAASDLDTFSTQYGLPLECAGGATPPACFDFRQVNETGGSTLPANNSGETPGWALEISLDIEWAHAIAPAATILLVEANSDTLTDLLPAVRYASQNANYVSNSWGSSEFSTESEYDSDFTTPGVSYFAATGDVASELSWPATSPDVIAVGGTSLSFTAGGTLAQESAWDDGGGGCSAYEPASPYQSTGGVSCAGKRATPDLALDADPSSGISVYDSVPYENQTGWWTVGGTSAATVMVAADAAVSGADVNAQYVYANPANIPFRDIVDGSNGHPALTGFDLASGLGSWSYTPGAPTGLSATGGGGGITLDWAAPSGAAVGEYDVWRGTASGAETTEVATLSAAGPTMTFTDATAGAGQTYYYEVQAVNSAGLGPFSNEAQATAASLPATQLVYATAPPSSATAGQTFPVVVDAEDADGDTVTSDSTTAVGLGVNGGGGGFACATSPSHVVDGVASFSGCYYTVANATAYSLTAAASGLPSVVASTVISPGAAAQLFYGTAPPSAVTVGVTFPVVVDEQDAYGNIESADSSTVVSLSVIGGGGEFSCSTSTAALSAGVASFSGCHYGVASASAFSLTAAAGALKSATAATSVTAAASPNAKTSQPGSADSAAAAVIKILTRTLTVQAGKRTGVKLACSDAVCDGVVSITQRKVTHVRIDGKTVSVTKTVILGETSYALAVGRSVTKTITLKSAGRAALGSASKANAVYVTVKVTVAGGKTKSVTVKVI
jgi:hypothetical protein